MRRHHLWLALWWAGLILAIVFAQAMTMTYADHHGHNIDRYLDVIFVCEWVAIAVLVVPHVYAHLRKSAREDEPSELPASPTAAASSSASKSKVP